MKRWKAYFFNILVSKESKNKKPFKYLTTKSDYLKGLRGVLKKSTFLHYTIRKEF